MAHDQPLLSLRDVAREAGVHHSTVSRALHDDPRLPTETRRRIQEIAQRLGYRSNPLVSDLISNLKRSRLPPQLGVIGFLDTLSRPAGPFRRSPLGQPFYEGAMQRATARGYRMDLFQIHQPGMTLRRMAQILRTRGIRGLIIDSHYHPRGHLPLDIAPFACVMRGYSNLRPNLHRVSHNHFQGLLLAVHFLRHLGYRRLGLFLPQRLDRLTNNQWTTAFLTYQSQVPASSRVPLHLAKGSPKQEIGPWFRRHKPDAILGNEAGIPNWLGDLGFAVPRDVGFANLDLDAEKSSQAGIWQHMDQLGASAVDTLTGQMQRNELGRPALAKLILQEGTWRDGPTVAPQAPQRRK